MSIFSEIIGGGAGGLGDLFTKIMDAIKLSPEKKAEMQQALASNALEVQKLQNELEQKAIEAESKAIDVAGQNIRAETQSEDAFVRRARPSFLYVMILAIGFSLIVFPLISIISGKGLVFTPIPDSYLQLFGVAFLGYTGARSWEKISGKK